MSHTIAQGLFYCIAPGGRCRRRRVRNFPTRGWNVRMPTPEVMPMRVYQCSVLSIMEPPANQRHPVCGRGWTALFSERAVTQPEKTRTRSSDTPAVFMHNVLLEKKKQSFVNKTRVLLFSRLLFIISAFRSKIYAVPPGQKEEHTFPFLGERRQALEAQGFGSDGCSSDVRKLILKNKCQPFRTRYKDEIYFIKKTPSLWIDLSLLLENIPLPLFNFFILSYIIQMCEQLQNSQLHEYLR